MATFVEVGLFKLVNLADVHRMEKKDSRDPWEFFDADGRSLGVAHIDPGKEAFTQIIPVVGSFERTRRDYDSRKDKATITDRVVAWGLTITGDVVPICLEDMANPYDGYLLRRAGEKQFIAPWQCTYDSVEEWLTPPDLDNEDRGGDGAS